MIGFVSSLFFNRKRMNVLDWNKFIRLLEVNLSFKEIQVGIVDDWDNTHSDLYVQCEAWWYY